MKKKGFRFQVSGFRLWLGSVIPALLLLVTLVTATAALVQTDETYGTTIGTYAGIHLKWTSVISDTTVTRVPAVLVLHPGGYKAGNAGPVNPVCFDLANAGFWALATEYRLAPPGGATGSMANPPHSSPGQNDLGDDGHYPEQTTDVQMAIRAARIDSRCNGLVYLVGGSAGASHSLYMAATGIPGDDQPDLVVLCSTGISNLDDGNVMSLGAIFGETDPNQAVLNYIPGVDPGDLTARNWTPYHSTLITASPVTYLKTANAAPRLMPPIFILQGSEDSYGIAGSTGNNVITYGSDDAPIGVENGANGLLPKMKAMGWRESASPVPQNFCFKQWIVPTTLHEHAFNYWATTTGVAVGAGPTIITWLQGGVPTPLPTPTQTYLSGKARARVAARRGS